MILGGEIRCRKKVEKSPESNAIMTLNGKLTAANSKVLVKNETIENYNVR